MRRALAAVVVSGSLLFPGAERLTAQTEQAWKADWSVECTFARHLVAFAQVEAAQFVAGILSSRLGPVGQAITDEVVEELIGDLCDDSEPNWGAGNARRELRAAEAWHRSLGFTAPILWTDEEDDRKHYALLDADRFRDGPRLFENGVYRRDGSIHISPAYYDPGGTAITTAVEAHEPFHGVQNGSDPSSFAAASDAMAVNVLPPNYWVYEGTARAVEIAWTRKPGTWRRASRNSRPYDVPLNVTNRYIALPRGHGYATSIFWLDVGRQLEARDWIGYLPPVLNDLSRGLAGIDDVLRQAFAARNDGEAGGLYRAYPEFVRHVLSDPGDVMTHFTLPRRVGLSLPVGGVRDQVVRPPEEILPMATYAYPLRVEVPAGVLAGLRIDLETASPDDADRLHLIVDRHRYNRHPTPSNPRARRNVFLDAIEGDGGTRLYYVRVANVARRADLNRPVTVSVRFTLTAIGPCDSGLMMAALHPQAANMLSQTTMVMAGTPMATPMRALLPADQYEAEFEEVPGLHPARGFMSLSLDGNVFDRGLACTEPIGTNPLLDFHSGDPAAAQGRLAEALEAMMAPATQELLDEARADSTDTPGVMQMMFPELRGDDVDDGTDAVLSSMGRDDDALISLYSPNGLAWQSGMATHGAAPGWQMLRHGGIRQWQANAGATVTVRLPGVSPAALRKDSTYAAEIVTMPTAIGTPLYSRWWGSESTESCNGIQFSLLDGSHELISTDGLSGDLTITEITGASVEGSFTLSGTARVAQTDYRIVTRAGCRTNEPSVRVRSGTLSLVGDFVAPAASEVERAERAVALTYAAERPTENDADVTPTPAVYPPGLDDEGGKFVPIPPIPIPWPSDRDPLCKIFPNHPSCIFPDPVEQDDRVVDPCEIIDCSEPDPETCEDRGDCPDDCKARGDCPDPPEDDDCEARGDCPDDCEARGDCPDDEEEPKEPPFPLGPGPDDPIGADPPADRRPDAEPGTDPPDVVLDEGARVFLRFVDVPDGDLVSAEQNVSVASSTPGGALRVRGSGLQVSLVLPDREILACRFPGGLAVALAGGLVLDASVDLRLNDARDQLELELAADDGRGSLTLSAGPALGGGVTVGSDGQGRMQISVTGARLVFSAQGTDVSCDGVGSFVATLSATR